MRETILDEGPELLVHQSFVFRGLPAPGADPRPAQRTGERGQDHVVVEAGETEDVTTWHLDWVEVEPETDGTHGITQLDVPTLALL